MDIKCKHPLLDKELQSILQIVLDNMVRSNIWMPAHDRKRLRLAVNIKYQLLKLLNVKTKNCLYPRWDTN